MPISELCTTTTAPNATTLAALHDAFLGASQHNHTVATTSSCVEFVDVAAQVCCACVCVHMGSHV